MNNQIITRHQTKNFTITAGTFGDEIEISLWSGLVVGAAIEVVGDLPAVQIDVSVKDNGGHRLEDSTSIKNWAQRQGGNYQDSLKPLHIEGNQVIKLSFASEVALPADLKGQVILLVKQNA